MISFLHHQILLITAFYKGDECSIPLMMTCFSRSTWDTDVFNYLLTSLGGGDVNEETTKATNKLTIIPIVPKPSGDMPNHQ